MFKLFGIVLTALCLAPFQSAQADPVACPGTPVTVESDDAALTGRICDAARHSMHVFGACDIRMDRPVTIRVTFDVQAECFAIYHCGKDQVDILPMAVISRLRRPDSAFSALADAAFFDSMVAHELAHAAFDGIPCPFDNCTATAEYLAYNMQIMSLSPKDRAVIEADVDMSQRVSLDQVNAMILWMAPDRFARLAWAHLNQRDDPCAYIRRIMRGDVLFDTENM